LHQLFIDSKKAYDSVKREVLYNILTEFGAYIVLVGKLRERDHLEDPAIDRRVVLK